MPVQLINPTTPAPSGMYHHASIATGTRTIYVAGQVGEREDGSVPADLTDQVEQCVINIASVLAAAGAGFADVARMTAYFVDWTPDKVDPYADGLARAARRLGIDVPTPPLTGIGVAALARPEILVELEAIAVLP